jgi:hypothetical protein
VLAEATAESLEVMHERYDAFRGVDEHETVVLSTCCDKFEGHWLRTEQLQQ